MKHTDWWMSFDMKYVIEKIKGRKSKIKSMIGEATEDQISELKKLTSITLPDDYVAFLKYFGNQKTDQISKDDEKEFYLFDFSLGALIKEYSSKKSTTDLEVIKDPKNKSLILIGIRQFGEEVYHLYLNCLNQSEAEVVQICNCGEKCREDLGISLKEYVATNS
ncbi:MAG: hypothetical protein COA79_12750 [Planctomycetota bacterium]|nr:MAG: hypothetical protein COA79_12750 [Planctomycetota bacterium]